MKLVVVCASARQEKRMRIYAPGEPLDPAPPAQTVAQMSLIFQPGQTEALQAMQQTFREGRCPWEAIPFLTRTPVTVQTATPDGCLIQTIFSSSLAVARLIDQSLFKFCLSAPNTTRGLRLSQRQRNSRLSLTAMSWERLVRDSDGELQGGTQALSHEQIGYLLAEPELQIDFVLAEPPLPGGRSRMPVRYATLVQERDLGTNVRVCCEPMPERQAPD